MYGLLVLSSRKVSSLAWAGLDASTDQGDGDAVQSLLGLGFRMRMVARSSRDRFHFNTGLKKVPSLVGAGSKKRCFQRHIQM